MTATRYKAPCGAWNVYTDFINGDDANDGTQASPFRTVNGALYRTLNEADFDGSREHQTSLTINMAPGVTDEEEIHLSGCHVGKQGGGAVVIRGGYASRLKPVSGNAVGVFCHAIVQVESVLLEAPGAGIACQLGGRVYVNTGVAFMACGAGHMVASDPGSHIIIAGDYTVWGGASVHMMAQLNSAIQAVGNPSCVFGNNAAFQAFAMAGVHGVISTGAMSYNHNGFTVTGQRYISSQVSYVAGPPGGFPGDAPGWVASGGVYQ